MCRRACVVVDVMDSLRGALCVFFVAGGLASSKHRLEAIRQRAGALFFGRRACACEVDAFLFVQSGERLPLRSEPTVRGLHTLRADGLGLCLVFGQGRPIDRQDACTPDGPLVYDYCICNGPAGGWCTYLTTVVLRRPMLPEDALGHHSPGSSPGSPYG